MPSNPVVIGTKSDSLTAGDYVTFRNITRSSVRRVQCNSSGEAVLENVPSDWANGDTVIIEVYGRINKGTSTTITKGGINTNLGTLSADSTSAAVNL